jgi:sarcosine oxidase
VLLQRAQRYGAELRFGVTVHGWQASTGAVSVSTSDGEVQADRLVLAPGAWAPELTRLPVPMRVERRIQHYWGPADPSGYGPDRFPVWIWSYAEDLAAYGLAAVDGRVKAAMHFGGQVVDPSVGAEPARPDEVEAMRRWFDGRMPGLAEAAWLGATPCLYTLTPDEHFVIGPHPDHAQVAVACGFSGHGFKFVPVVAGEHPGRPRGRRQHPLSTSRCFDTRRGSRPPSAIPAGARRRRRAAGPDRARPRRGAGSSAGVLP